MVWNTLNSDCKWKLIKNLKLQSLILEILDALTLVPCSSTKLEAAPNLKRLVIKGKIPRRFKMVWDTFNSDCNYKSSINFQLRSLILEISGASSLVPHTSTKLEAAPNLKRLAIKRTNSQTI